MKDKLVLLYILLLPSIFSTAQPAGKKKLQQKSGTMQHSVDLNKKTSIGTSIEQKSIINGKLPVDKNNVTGIWKGYFVQNTLGVIEDKYRFEVQVAEQDNHSLTAVTYSYKTTVFYGKADATGIYTAKSKNFLLKELKLTDIKLTDNNTAACLMTCYLDFDKIGNTQTLTGSFTSISIKDKSDCGSGKVYLEKSLVTDFYKEDFLAKRESELRKKERLATKKSNSNSIAKNNLIIQPKIKPGAENNILNLPSPNSETIVLNKIDSSKRSVLPITNLFPKPEVMKLRGNDLIKTIVTSEKEFKIELYDNGEIDGDRISVYHNNELIVSNKALTDKPITFTIHTDENIPVHEFVMVAENMGTIPPNTSLMIITAGSQRYELFVTSSDQKNAVVKVEYKAEGASNK